MLGIVFDRCERDLVCAEGTFDRNAIHFLRARPSLGRAEYDHGPDRLFCESVLTCLLLNSPNLGVTILKRLRQNLMHDLRIIALDKVRVVTTAYIKSLQVGVAGASLGRWP